MLWPLAPVAPRCRERRIGPCAPLTAELPAGSWRPFAPASPCRPTGPQGTGPVPDNATPTTKSRIRQFGGRVLASEQPADGTSEETAGVAPSSRQGAHVMTGSATTSRSSIAPSAVIAWRVAPAAHGSVHAALSSVHTAGGSAFGRRSQHPIPRLSIEPSSHAATGARRASCCPRATASEAKTGVECAAPPHEKEQPAASGLPGVPVHVADRL